MSEKIDHDSDYKEGRIVREKAGVVQMKIMHNISKKYYLSSVYRLGKGSIGGRKQIEHEVEHYLGLQGP